MSRPGAAAPGPDDPATERRTRLDVERPEMLSWRGLEPRDEAMRSGRGEQLTEPRESGMATLLLWVMLLRGRGPDRADGSTPDPAPGAAHRVRAGRTAAAVRAGAALDPAIILPVVLPPLLFAATQRATTNEFRRDARPILLLAVGLTVVTAASVAYVVHLAGFAWGPAWVLGAVVAPPDPVAATAVARRLRLPHRLVTVLEGEGMFNDATALVLYSLAVAAVVTGHISGTRRRAASGGGGRGGRRDRVARRPAQPTRAGRPARRDRRDDRHGRHAVRRLPARGPGRRVRRARRPEPGVVPAKHRAHRRHLRRLAARTGGLAIRRLPDHEPGIRVHRLRAYGGARDQPRPRPRRRSRGPGHRRCWSSSASCGCSPLQRSRDRTPPPQRRLPLRDAGDVRRRLGGDARRRDGRHRTRAPDVHRSTASVPDAGTRSSSSASPACWRHWWCRG